MTAAAPPPGPAVWVVGVDAAGTERVRQRLAHGDDPQRLLGRAGYASPGPHSVTADPTAGTVTVVYPVAPGERTPLPPEGGPVPRDADLVVAPGETPVVRQRLAVYGLVTSPRGVLLTENSARTNAPGTWALAGGGVDPGETPEQALHREVWEETGQRVVVAGVATLTTRHWVGRAPGGVLEDFHAVRLVYRADCPEPGDPVVHDVDGTTAAAAWVRPEDLPSVRLASGTREILAALSRGGDG